MLAFGLEKNAKTLFQFQLFSDKKQQPSVIGKSFTAKNSSFLRENLDEQKWSHDVVDGTADVGQRTKIVVVEIAVVRRERVFAEI